jgi:hypothetical protein
MVFTCDDKLRGEPPPMQMLPPQRHACQAASIGVLRQAFKYDPSIRKKAAADGTVGDDVIRLDPVFVTEEKVSPFLLSEMDHKRALFEANKTSLKNGIGAMISPNVEVGIKPHSYEFLPPKTAIPCWNLISIRF